MGYSNFGKSLDCSIDFQTLYPIYLNFINLKPVIITIESCQVIITKSTFPKTTIFTTIIMVFTATNLAFIACTAIHNLRIYFHFS